MDARPARIENRRAKRRATLPRPYRAQKSGKSNLTHTLIRHSKDQYVRQLYARLGPEEFYRRRLEWLAANGKWTSYHRLVAYLAKAGIQGLAVNGKARSDKPQYPRSNFRISADAR
jgi:hypothetical protein